MEDDPTHTLYAEAIMGKDAEAFLKSELGQYITGCAQQEIDEALEELKSVDPGDSKAIRTLQNKIKVAERVPKWLTEVINTGKNAIELLDESEE